MRVKGDKILLSASATKWLTVLYKHSCHLVVDSYLHVIPIISLLQDTSKGNMAFVLTLAIATT